MNRKILLSVLVLLLPAFACAGPIDAYSMFGGNHTQLGNGVTINSGYVGSNGNVDLDGSTHLKSNVYAGGNITLGNSTVVDGDATARGKVTLNGGATVAGNVDAGQASGLAVTLGSTASVGGTITRNAGTTINTGGGATFGTSATGTPDAFTNVTLPAPTAFGAGGNSFSTGNNQPLTLAAGSYHNLNLGASNTLNLSAGNYYFDSLTTGGSNIFRFDLSAGAISLFFTGNVHIGNSLDVMLIGGDASDIYAETKGDWTQDGSGEWFGTIFGSGANSDLSFGHDSTLTGAFIATHNLSIDGGSTVKLASADTGNSVPEPASVMLAAIALGGLALSRRRG